MARYTGSQCMICKKAFREGEDIVTCPDCGTPYHRECWQIHEKCINLQLHATGSSWTEQEAKHRQEAGGKICPSCGFVNIPGVKTCGVCNASLQEQPRPTESSGTAAANPEIRQIRITMPDGSQHTFHYNDPCCGMSPDEKIENERLGDLAEFVRSNTMYYIPLFKKFHETRQKISFNLPCILFPYFYFANRKMWFMAILSGLLQMVSNLPGVLLTMLQTLTDKTYLAMLQTQGVEIHAFDNLLAFLQGNEDLLIQLQTPCFFLGMALRIIFCLFGNYLYFRFVLRSVKRIREKLTPSMLDMKSTLLHIEGGTNIWNILGCCGLYLGAISMLYLILIFF